MTRTQQNIKDYLRRRSHGVIDLTISDCNEIINMVVNNIYTRTDGVAKLFKYEAQTGIWKETLTRSVDEQRIKAEVIKALDEGNHPGAYMWECHNAAVEFEGRIYTLNAFLF